MMLLGCAPLIMLMGKPSWNTILTLKIISVLVNNYRSTNEFCLHDMLFILCFEMFFSGQLGKGRR